MNRLDRLSAILIHLQSKKVVTAQEIASRFEISLRTVYRDIRSLEEAGVPIGAEAGVGYFLSDAWSLPPVMFTNEEAIALMVAGKFIEHIPDSSTRHQFSSALFKIKSVLRNSQKEQLTALEQQTVVAHYINQNALQARNTTLMPVIQQALIEKHVLKIEYLAGSSQEKTERSIEPIGLCFYNRDWHLIAWCKLRNDYRDFRVDRIANCWSINEYFDRKKHPTLGEYFTTWVQKLDLQEIRLRCSFKMANIIDTSRYWYGYVGQEIDNEGVVMTFLNHDLEGIARWIISLGPDIQAEHPLQLQHLVKNQVEVWMDFFDKRL